MKKYLVPGVLLVVSVLAPAVQAGPAAQAFGTCLTDALSGKERKDMAQWIYFAIAAHPEMKSFSKVTDEDRNRMDQYMGKLVTRLISEDCPEKAKAAMKEGGAYAFQQAFGLVGQVAMRELMTDPNVQKAIMGYTQYLDQKKLKALGEE